MIYIAAPLFSEMERVYIDKIVDIVSEKLELKLWDDFYIPHRDNDDDAFDSEIYNKNIEYLNHCDIMIAVLDGKDVDSGTAFEIGYFGAQNKVVLGLLTDKRSYDEEGDLNTKLNTMILCSLNSENIFDYIDDLIDTLYDILMENYE